MKTRDYCTRAVLAGMLAGAASFASEAVTVASSQTTLLYFHSKASVLSYEMTEGLMGDVRLATRLAPLKFQMFDVDTPQGLAAANAYSVPWVPTFVLTANGKELRRLERPAEASVLAAWLDGKQIAQAGAETASLSTSAGIAWECSDDPPNDAPSADLDVVRVCAGMRADKLLLRVDVSDAPSVQSSPRFNVFLDTDDDPETGYATATFKGADYVVQGGLLYKFSGSNPNEWKFDQVGPVTVEVRGVSLRWTVPVSLFKKVAREIRIWVGSQTPNWQPADWAPDGTPVVVAVGSSSQGAAATGGQPNSTMPSPEKSSAAAGTGQPVEKASHTSSKPTDADVQEPAGTGSEEGEVLTLSDAENDAPSPALDLRSVRLAESADKFTLSVQLGAAPNLPSLHVFIDADGKSETGYSDGTRSGADFMIEGTTLYKHQPSAGTGWGWDALGALNPPPRVQGSTVLISIPRSRIGLAAGRKIRLWLATTDASWNTVDTLPDGAAATYPK